MTETSKRTAAGAFGLTAEQVTSPELFDLESRRVFDTHWICVGRESDLDPQSNCLPVELDNHLLLLVRNKAGDIKCFHNICRHRGSRLVDENNCSKVGGKIVCPYHAWAYDRDGSLVSSPNMADVGAFDSSEYGLKPVSCRVWNGFVWIRIRGELDFDLHFQQLDTLVAPWGIGDLQTHATIEYVVNANWKLIFQNYNECYHCPSVHPALNRLTPYKNSTNDLEAGPILGGPMQLADDALTMSMDGAAVGTILPGLSPQQSRIVAYYTLYPTMFLSVHPDYVLVHRLERWAVDQTRVVCEFLFHPESLQAAGFSADRAIEFWDMTNRQDWRVCESTQEGMSADGYEPGPYSPLESVVAAFDRHHQQTMGPVCQSEQKEE